MIVQLKEDKEEIFSRTKFLKKKKKTMKNRIILRIGMKDLLRMNHKLKFYQDNSKWMRIIKNPCLLKDYKKTNQEKKGFIDKEMVLMIIKIMKVQNK